METERDHWVYRAYDAAGRLLYIGCSRSLKSRRSNHKASSWWFDHAARFVLAGPFSFDVARRIEREQVDTLGPYFNETSAEISQRMTEMWAGRRLENQFATTAEFNAAWDASGLSQIPTTLARQMARYEAACSERISA